MGFGVGRGGDVQEWGFDPGGSMRAFLRLVALCPAILRFCGRLAAPILRLRSAGLRFGVFRPISMGAAWACSY